MDLLREKIAVITGAGSGIGAGVAELFAKEGAHVFMSDIENTLIQNKAAILRAQGGSVFPFAADVRNSRAMAGVVDDAIGRFGRVDILINNAGVYPRQNFLEMTEGQWDAIQEINVKGTFHCTKLVIPQMVKQHSGAIVNISSVTFFLGMKDLTHYTASKGAIIGFTRSLAREMGEYGIHVNCITPGAVETEGEKAVATPKQVAALVESQSLKRRIVPEDIAKACLFLSSDLGSGMTGQTLNVDGGWIMY
jgi:3-oxoacyl-[acyl-carrier protein] reductase